MAIQKRFQAFRIAGLAAILLLCTAVCAHAIGYTITDLGVVSADKPVSIGNGVDSLGNVAVTGRNGSGSSIRAFLYSAGSYYAIDLPAGYTESYALAMTDCAQIVGGLRNASTGLFTGFHYHGGMTIRPPADPDVSSDARAVDPPGNTAGVSYASDGRFRAVTWAGELPVVLPNPFAGGPLSEANGIWGDVIAGSASDSGGTFHAMRYNGSTATVLGTPGGYWDSFATGINSARDIVGFSSTYTSTVAVKWPAGSETPTVIGGLAGFAHTTPAAINAGGWIVGTAWISAHDNRTAFVYDGSTIRDLTGLIPLDSFWQLKAANGINDAGQITGYGVSVSGFTHAYLLNPITGTVTGAKLSRDCERVSLTNASVTAVFPHCFYIEALDRHVGIRVKGNLGRVIEDQEVSVIGRTLTENGERYIDAETIVVTGTRDLKPLGMTTKALGGRGWFYNPASGAGQRGVKDGTGANTIGLLVRIWGKVTESIPDEGKFYVDDGSGAEGICVSPDDPGMVPPPNCYVEVTGISSCAVSGTDLVNVLKPRYAEDMRLVGEPGPPPP